MKHLTALAMTLPLAMLAGCEKKADAPVTSAAPGNAAAAPVAYDANSQWLTTVTETPEGGMRMGNPDAALKLMEYGSRSCPHCAKFSSDAGDELKAMVASGNVSYEFRDFPLHAPDLALILLGHCGGPAPFFAILDQTMAQQDQLLAPLQSIDNATAETVQKMTTFQQSEFWADKTGYRQFVLQRGIAEDQAKQCLNDQGRIDKLAAQLKTANDKYKITGTPTFFLNGDQIPNVNTWEGVKQALKAKGA